MNCTPKIIARLIDNESIHTYTGAKNFIDGYSFCLSDEAEPRVLGLTENRILPGFNIFIKNKYNLNGVKPYDTVFDNMKLSDEEKYSEFINCLKEYSHLPAVLRDPVYDDIYASRYTFGNFHTLYDVKKRLSYSFEAFCDSSKPFTCDSAFKDFNDFALDKLSACEGENWFDVIIGNYTLKDGLQKFYEIYDKFCNIKSSETGCYIKNDKIPVIKTVLNKNNFFNNSVLKKFKIDSDCKKVTFMLKKDGQYHKFELTGNISLFINKASVRANGEIKIIGGDIVSNDSGRKELSLVFDSDTMGFMEIGFDNINTSETPYGRENVNEKV